jgi:formiminotetrahydrofolate cyclodeaminase
MTLSAKPLAALLEDFRSTAPTPGGGSAAALAGAVGASLLAMVAGLPKPRAASEAELAELKRIGERSTELARALEGLIDRDAAAYDLVVLAYRMPKGTDDEKAARSNRIQASLKAAIEAPLDVMRSCAEAAALAPRLSALGNPNASSDVQVGAELLRAGIRGARLNVEINLDSVKDKPYVDAVAVEVARLVSESGAGSAPSGSS